jgi:hypothetical protein
MAILVATGFTPFAMASAYIECGKKLDEDKTEVKDSVFIISSEDDVFNGPASGKSDGWSMTFNGQEYPPKKATAKTRVNKKGTVTSIVVTLKVADIPTKLVVVKPYSENPRLIEYMQNKGGNYNRGEDWVCISDQD